MYVLLSSVASSAALLAARQVSIYNPSITAGHVTLDAAKALAEQSSKVCHAGSSIKTQRHAALKRVLANHSRVPAHKRLLLKEGSAQMHSGKSGIGVAG